MATTRILVPLDGSPFGDRILPRVAPLLRRPGTEVCLVSIQPDRAELSDGLRRHVQKVQLGLKAEGVAADYRVHAGDPATEILRVADSWKPDVIAMSTHGRSGPARWAMGSVAERVLRASRHPVLVANPMALAADAQPILRRILVPLDVGPLSTEILPLVIEVAKGFGAGVTLFRALPQPTLPVRTYSIELPLIPTREDALAALEPVRAQVAAAGVDAQMRAVVGEPATAILEAVRDEGVDLVALSTHGRSGVARWVFGSVAEKVLRACPVPMLVKRTAAFAAAGEVAA